MTPTEGTVLDNQFVLVKYVGEGGMGRVFRAEDRRSVLADLRRVEGQRALVAEEFAPVDEELHDAVRRQALGRAGVETRLGPESRLDGLDQFGPRIGPAGLGDHVDDFVSVNAFGGAGFHDSRSFTHDCAPRKRKMDLPQAGGPNPS